MDWDVSSDDNTGVEVRRHKASGGLWVPIDQGTFPVGSNPGAVTFTDSNVPIMGISYCYKVRQIDDYSNTNSGVMPGYLHEDYGSYSGEACAAAQTPPGFVTATAVGVVYVGSGWGTTTNGYGWDQSWLNATGNKATFTFSGDAVTWYFDMNWWSGIAHVKIDGNDIEDVDQYAPWDAWSVARPYSGLGSGSHTIEIIQTGSKNAGSYYANINLDGFEVGLNPLVGSGSYGGAHAYAGSNWNEVGDGGWTCNPSDSARFNFEGTSVTWWHDIAPETGWAVITIDGVIHSTINTYNATQEFGHSNTFSGLSSGPHVLHILNYDACIDVEGIDVGS